MRALTSERRLHCSPARGPGCDNKRVLTPWQCPAPPGGQAPAQASSAGPGVWKHGSRVESRGHRAGVPPERVRLCPHLPPGLGGGLGFSTAGGGGGGCCRLNKVTIGIYMGTLWARGSSLDPAVWLPIRDGRQERALDPALRQSGQPVGVRGSRGSLAGGGWQQRGLDAQVTCPSEYHLRAAAIECGSVGSGELFWNPTYMCSP